MKTVKQMDFNQLDSYLNVLDVISLSLMTDWNYDIQ